MEVQFEVEALKVFDPIQVISRDHVPFQIYDLQNQSSKDHVTKLLQKFGSVEEFKVIESPNCNKAFVTIDTTVGAYYARKALDGYRIRVEKTADAKSQSVFTLRLKFMDPM